LKIWVDNGLVEDSSGYLDSNSWPRGTGLFETLRTENGSVQLLSRHMRRAIASARELSIPIPNEDVISQAIDELLAATPQAVGRLRLSFSIERFVATHEKYLDDNDSFRVILGQHVGMPAGRQHKVFPYGARLDLLQSAMAIGCHEVILTDAEDRVLEGAVSNFAFRIDGQWRTTPITSGILPGVLRAVAIEECGVVVKDLTRADVSRCEAAIVMSSLKIARPVASIDGRILEIDSDVSDICIKLRQFATTH
jgi:branched-subunit amino acid aminotransferase/4-amino-4-deoxychorismate lyase